MMKNIICCKSRKGYGCKNLRGKSFSCHTTNNGDGCVYRMYVNIHIQKYSYIYAGLWTGNAACKSFCNNVTNVHDIILFSFLQAGVV